MHIMLCVFCFCFNSIDASDLWAHSNENKKSEHDGHFLRSSLIKGPVIQSIYSESILYMNLNFHHDFEITCIICKVFGHSFYYPIRPIEQNFKLEK